MMPTSKIMRSLFIILGLVGYLVCSGCMNAFAQQCTDSAAEMKNGLRQSSDSEFILRASAILDESALPVLRERPRNESRHFTGSLFADPEAATDVALAKLGDGPALRRMAEELGQKFFNKDTIQKLEYVNNDSALTILMDYFLKNRFNKSVVVDFGDVRYSPIAEIRSVFNRMLPDPPRFPTDSDDWDHWWSEIRQHPIIVPVSKRVSEPQLKCWGRLADWKFRDAVPHLYQMLGSKSLPLLEQWNSYGDRTALCHFGEFCGIVRATLAKAGNKEEFSRIADELNSPSFEDALEKLSYIGGRDAVQLLIDALDLHSFLPGTVRSTPYFKKQALRLQTLILAALPGIVRNPPLSNKAQPTPENIERWRSWWDNNKN